MAPRSKAQICGRSLAEITGSNPAGAHVCLSVVNFVSCEVEVSAAGRSFIHGSPTKYMCL